MPDVVDVESDVKKLRSEIDRLNKEAVEKRAAADKLRDDMMSSGVNLSSLHQDDADAFEKIDEAYKEADFRTEQVQALRARLDKVYGWTERTGAGTGPSPAGPNRAARRASWGARVASSDAFQKIKRSGSATTEGARIDSEPAIAITRDELMDMLRARAGLDLGSGQAMVTPDMNLFPPVEIPVRPVMLLDLINKETTNSDIVYWTQQTTRTLASAFTATGTNAPQATLAFTRKTAAVHRLPVILTAPKEVLADEGRVQGLLDRQLQDDVRLTLEGQALGGDGTGENFTGILNTSGIGAVTQGSTGHTGEYALDAIHRAITYVRLHLFQDPDGIGLHPTDLETVVLQKDGYKRYIFPPVEDQASIWGFPVTSSPVFTQGTGLVGNFRLGATLWIREDVAVTASDGYTDTSSGVNYFSAGLVAILAQLRAAFAVERAFAFCTVASIAGV